MLDPGETLVVKLTSATTATRTVTVDDTATKTTTIQEEDMVAVSVAAVLVEDNDQTPEDESEDRSRVEEGETASFVVTLDGEVSGTVSVPYATANVTAESGSGKDYTAATGTLEFTGGQKSKTIEVTTLEDSLNEAAETYTLTLTSVSGPAGVKLGTASATGTIEDDDALTAALGTTYTTTVAEGGDATFAVDVSGGTSTADVVVNYVLDSSSTATSGTDYTAPGGKLTIAAGDASGTITIATLTDAVLDPGETLVVKLTSASTDTSPNTRAVTVDATATKTTTIQEEDMVSVSVEAVLVEDDDQTPEDETDDRSRVEEGETASFVVTLDGEVSGTVSVPYATANVTAESGSGKDYTTASGTLEFTAGETRKTIEVTTLEDGLNEADETYTLTLTSVSGPAGVKLGTASATGTIEDDDPISAALSATYTTTVAEGGDATYEVELSGGTSTAEVVVNYEVDANSTATSGTDYTAPGGKLTIAAAGTSGTITIETLTDAVLDPGETVVVKLTSATTDTRTVTVDATATKTTTIQEEDMVSVSVAAVLVEDNDQTPEDESEDRSRVEEGETASFVVTLDGEVSGTVSVPYATANVTAEAGAGKDYTAASGTLEFTAGQTSKTIEVTTLEDGLNEAAETYTLTLTSVTGPAGVKLGTASATGTIEDDDPISAALGTTYTTTVAEGGDATYEVELSGGTSTAEVVVNYEVDANSTATSGTDYTVPDGKLTIAAAGTSGTITIATLTDAVLDPGETLVVKLTSATTDTRAVTVDATATRTTTIQEEDMVSVSVAALLVEDNDQTPEDESDDRSRVEEGETASFVVTLDGEVSGTVSVPYATANVTAESGAGKDYTAASGTLEFTAGQTSKTIEVTTLEDGLNEAAETYTLTLTSVTGPAGVKLGTASATGTIEDDDELTAALGATYTTTVAEGGDATYEVELSGGTSTAEVVVNYEVDANSTATSGTDYTAPGGKLTIAAAGTSGTITIETLTDAVLDPGETVVVKLTSATTDTRTVTVDATATKTTTIQEEDMVSVSVAAVLVEDDDQTPEDESEDRSRVEEGETASFVVTLDGEVSGTVSVPYATANVTAEAGAGKDYTAASGTLEFTAGQTSKTIEVTTLEDSLNEADETYTLTLTSVTGPAGVKLGTASATGTIEDDDELTAALGATYTTTVAEGGDATYEVELSGGTSTAEVVVNYEVDASSTATSGTDYTAPGGKLTIAAAGTSGTITIATLTDAVLDPGETVVVKLTSATTDTRAVTVDATATKTTTIQEEGMVSVSVAAVLVEDDDQTPKDETDDRSRVEEGETASFVVTLDGEVSGTVSVPYTTANVTAESGSGKDYTAATGTLEFTGGQTSKTIEVTTLEDSLNEAAETYTLTLTSVSGPAGVKLGTASATGTIEDDDALTAALGTTYTTTVAEGGDATFAVDVSGGTSTADVVVDYEVDSSSTATSGTDYTAPGGKLTIAAAGTSGTITITTLTDAVLDPGETVVVKLTSATTDTRTVTVDATATKTTTIQEEDMVSVSVAAVLVEDNPDTLEVNESDDWSRVEEGETASFVVTLDGEVSGTVSVPYATANVTAEVWQPARTTRRRPERWNSRRARRARRSR